MTEKIIVPALGESVAEAVIAKWHKKLNDVVKRDELILELETEKVTLEINAARAGRLTKISKSENSTVEVGEIIGEISETSPQEMMNLEKVKNYIKADDTKNFESSKTNEFIKNDNVVDNQSDAELKVLAPSVQRLVNENNLNPNKILGSGKDGRITKGDILNHLQIAKNEINTTVPISNDNDNQKLVERVRMSRLRKTIALRLKQSQNTAAILTTFNEIDMTNVITLRQKYREEFEKIHKVKLGFISFFVKATVEALKAIPSVNAEIDGDDIIYKNYYDIGVAVGTEQGLVVPVLRSAHEMTFAEIEKNIAALGAKAREGKLAMSDLSGGTFSISNGGVYGSLMSTPIINPPQSGILGIHKTQERPIAINGKVEIRQMMYIALSYDHRIIDGREAVTFLVKIKDFLEAPERLLLNI